MPTTRPRGVYSVSKTRGLVFEGQRYWSPPGSVAPPLSLPDKSRFGNNGAFTDITWIQLPSGLWVMSFNGTSSSVALGNDVSFTTPSGLTLGAWFQTSESTWACILGRINNTWALSPNGAFVLVAGDMCGIEIRSNGAERDGTVTNNWGDGVWHYVVGTWDGANLYTYIDGVLEAGPVGAAQPGSGTTEDIFIGQRELGGSERFFTGYIAPILSIYNYALNLDQVNKHFEAERRFFGV